MDFLDVLLLLATYWYDGTQAEESYEQFDGGFDGPPHAASSGGRDIGSLVKSSVYMGGETHNHAPSALGDVGEGLLNGILGSGLANPTKMAAGLMGAGGGGMMGAGGGGMMGVGGGGLYGGAYSRSGYYPSGGYYPGRASYSGGSSNGGYSVSGYYRGGATLSNPGGASYPSGAFTPAGASYTGGVSYPSGFYNGGYGQQCRTVCSYRR